LSFTNIAREKEKVNMHGGVSLSVLFFKQLSYEVTLEIQKN